jgi:hypothetical protein
MHHEQFYNVEVGQESLPCDELVAEIKQRVTQLQNVLTRYSSSRYNHPAYVNKSLPSSGVYFSTLCTRTFKDVPDI